MSGQVGLGCHVLWQDTIALLATITLFLLLKLSSIPGIKYLVLTMKPLAGHTKRPRQIVIFFGIFTVGFMQNLTTKNKLSFSGVVLSQHMGWFVRLFGWLGVIVPSNCQRKKSLNCSGWYNYSHKLALFFDYVLTLTAFVFRCQKIAPTISLCVFSLELAQA